MPKEGELPKLSEWMTLDPVRHALAKIDPQNLPSDSFRQWPDEPENNRPEWKMSIEDLAYCHSSLRTDLHVLVLLTLANKEVARPNEIVEFLQGQDLLHKKLLSNSHVTPILHELSKCVHSGVDKLSDSNHASFEYIPNYEGLVSMAGHLYTFSKAQALPLADFLGVARGQKDRDGLVLYQGQNVSNSADRIRIVRYLAQSLLNSNLSPEYSMNAIELAEAVGVGSRIVRRQLGSLSASNLLKYQTTGPNKGAYQQYKQNHDVLRAKPSTIGSHKAFSDYMQDYVIVESRNLSRQGAKDYLLDKFPDLADMDQGELAEKIDHAMNRFLAEELILPETLFSHGSQSSITFPSGTDRLSLLEYSRVLGTMQKEDTKTIRKGLALGLEITNDREGITSLLRKARK